MAPGLKSAGVGEDHVNITWIPGEFDEEEKAPIGDEHYIKYRVKGADAWERADPEEVLISFQLEVKGGGRRGMLKGNFTVKLDGLWPGTTYEVVSVSVVTDEEGSPLEESASEPFYVTTAGEPASSATAAWLIALIIAIIILLILLILICLVVRNRGAKYPVSEKEREQGREPMLGKEEKGFGEYARPELEDEKRSLTGGSLASETDSMAEFGDPEQGNYNEDGSFIGIPPSLSSHPQQMPHSSEC